MATERSAAELNRDVVQRVFDAVARGDQAAANALHNKNFTLELNYGHPDGGAFRGDEIAGGRMRMIALLGLTDVELKEIIADGPTRVVVLADARGTDAAGEPWSTPAVELVALEDGKVTTTSLTLQGHVRLLGIARVRAEEVVCPRETAEWPAISVDSRPIGQ